MSEPSLKRNKPTFTVPSNKYVINISSLVEVDPEHTKKVTDVLRKALYIIDDDSQPPWLIHKKEGYYDITILSKGFDSRIAEQLNELIGKNSWNGWACDQEKVKFVIKLKFENIE
jgi:hypothetical protein